MTVFNPSYSGGSLVSFLKRSTLDKSSFTNMIQSIKNKISTFHTILSCVLSSFLEGSNKVTEYSFLMTISTDCHVGCGSSDKNTRDGIFHCQSFGGQSYGCKPFIYIHVPINLQDINIHFCFSQQFFNNCGNDSTFTTIINKYK